MRFNEPNWEAIHSFQLREIVSLATATPDVASRIATRPYSTYIGRWLPASLGGRVLEIGCGPGRFVALLAALGFEVTGADPVAYSAWEAIKAIRSVEFFEGVKAESLPFPDARFDHVACLNAMLYFDDPEKALNEMRRVIKPGGRLFLRTINRDNLVFKTVKKHLDPAGKNYYTGTELEALLKRTGFDVAQICTYGFYLPFWRMYWWYLVNGRLSPRMQEVLSLLTPRRNRMNIVAFASASSESRS